MRQKTRNALLTFLYPGRRPGDGHPPDEACYVAIPDNECWVSIAGDDRSLGEKSCAVFYRPQSLRDLAEVLNEAADMLEKNISKGER